MRVLLQPDERRDDQCAHMRALARAMAACGDHPTMLPMRAVRDPDYKMFDAICCWGWRRAGMLRSITGRDMLVMERGYVADRFRWTSLGWNGLNGRARFPTCEDGGARWERHFANLMKPWRPQPTGYAIVMGQVPSDTAVKGTNFAAWVGDAITAMRRRGLDVRFRPHPRGPKSRAAAPVATGTLDQTLAGAAVAVTFNSNSGVDAVLAGVPTITCDDGSMARAVSGCGLDAEIVAPDRTAWAHRIAHAQYLPEEMALPQTWQRLKAALH